MQFRLQRLREDAIGQDAMSQFVVIPLITIGLPSILSLVAWGLRERPGSLSFRIATWWVSLIKNFLS